MHFVGVQEDPKFFMYNVFDPLVTFINGIDLGLIFLLITGLDNFFSA